MCRYAIKELHAIRSASGASKIMMFVICSVVHMMAGLLVGPIGLLWGHSTARTRKRGANT